MWTFVLFCRLCRFTVHNQRQVFPDSVSPGPQWCETSKQFPKLFYSHLFDDSQAVMHGEVRHVASAQQTCKSKLHHCSILQRGTHMLFVVFFPRSFHCLSGLQPLLMKCDQNKCRDNSALCHPSPSLWSIWSGSVQFVIRKVWLEKLQSCTAQRSASSALILRYLISLRSFRTNPGLLLLPLLRSTCVLTRSNAAGDPLWPLLTHPRCKSMGSSIRKWERLRVVAGWGWGGGLTAGGVSSKSSAAC